MKTWNAERVAEAAGAQLLRAPAVPGGPERATIDSREVHPGDLFVGLPGARVDGAAFAADALAAGAWGVLVGAQAAGTVAVVAGEPPTDDAATDAAASGAVLAAPDPLEALRNLASAWRQELGAKTIAITGSTGKTSTKDILAALLAPHLATVSSPANYNTEIGVPLAVLAAPP